MHGLKTMKKETILVSQNMLLKWKRKFNFAPRITPRIQYKIGQNRAVFIKWFSINGEWSFKRKRGTLYYDPKKSVNHGVPGSSPGGGAKQNPIRPAILRVGPGFFVLILGREVYPDVTKWNREAQEGEQAKRFLEAILGSFSHFRGYSFSNAFFHLHTICTKIPLPQFCGTGMPPF